MSDTPAATLVTKLRAKAAEWHEMCGDVHVPLLEAADALEEANRQHKADRDALESAHFWLGELVPLTEELNADLKRFYQPDKGWPPHIAKANDLGDYKQVLSDLRAALEQSR